MSFLTPLIRAAAAGGGAGGGIGGAAAGGGLGNVLGGLGGAAEGATANIGQLGQALNQTGQGTQQLTQHLGRVNPHLGKMAAHLNSIANDAARYAQAFAPAEVKLFHLALHDLNASIGENVVPVVRLARDVFRDIGDTIAGFTPVVRPLVQAFTDSLRPVFRAGVQLFRDLGTAMLPLQPVLAQVAHVFEYLASQLASAGADAGEAFVQMTGTFLELAAPLLELYVVTQPVIPLLGELAREITLISRAVSNAVRDFRAFLGLPELERPNFDNASRGKGYSPATTTSPQALFARLQESAFGMGKESPEKKIPGKLDALLAALNDLPAAIARKLSEFIKEKGDQAADNLVGAVRGQFGMGAVELLARIPRFDGS